MMPQYIYDTYEHYNEAVLALHAEIKSLPLDDKDLPALVHALGQALTRRDIFKRKASERECIKTFSIREYLPSPEFPANVNYKGTITLSITYNSGEQPDYEIDKETLDFFMPYLRYKGQDWDSLAGYYNGYTLNASGWELTNHD